MDNVEAAVPAHAHRTFQQTVWARIPKCGARTRSGRPCLGLIVRGKKRCRMHGGAAGSGAQQGNRNRWRHGRFSRDVIEGRALLQLSAALNAFVDANFAIVVAIGRGDHQYFDRLVAAVEAKREAVATAGARYRRCLVQAGRGGEAEALAVDLATALEPPPAVELADAASG